MLRAKDKEICCEQALTTQAHPRAHVQGHLLAAIDARSKTKIPVVDNAWLLTFIFFFVSIIVCAMVVINMVVGVFVDCYNNQQQAVGRNDPPPLKSMMKLPVREPSGGIRVRPCPFSLVSLSSSFSNVSHRTEWRRNESSWGAGRRMRGLISVAAWVYRHTCTGSSPCKTST